MLYGLGLATGCPGDDGAGDGSGGSSTTVMAADSSSGEPASTGADSSSGGAVVVDYAMDIQPIFNGACTCHLQGPSGTMQAEVLTLNEGTSYGELVGTASMQSPLVRVAAGDLQGSYLWHKLQGTHLTVGGTGDPMPQVGMLTPQQQMAIEAWIMGGAEP